MKKLTIAALLTFAFYSPASAQPVLPQFGGWGCSNPATVASLSDCEISGAAAIVADGADSSDCTVGSGSSLVICCWDGSDWAACGGGGGGGGGSGDVESVGDCTTGDCFTDSGTGDSLVIEGTADSSEFTFQFPVEPSGDHTVTVPDETGTVCTTGAVCTGYSASAHTHTLGDTTATGWFTGSDGANKLYFEGATANSFEGLLTGADFTADRTVTIPDEDGTLCTTGSVCTGYGNVIGPGSALANSLAIFSLATGKTLAGSECTIEDNDSDNLGDEVVCPYGFSSIEQTCTNNSDCNFFSLPFNDGGGTPTCATMVAANVDLTSAFFELPKADGKLYLCKGAVETGEIAATSSGDVSAVGDCISGACFDGTGTANTLTFEGSSNDTVETLLTAANPTSSDKTITLPNETGTVCTTGSVCTGYQAAATDLSAFEAATDDAVPVGTGAAYTPTVISDCDPGSSSVVGKSCNYDTATNAFSATTIPTIKVWAPEGFIINQTGTAFAIDQCHCHMISLSQPINTIDDVDVRFATQNSGDDIVKVGLYSEAGTLYFGCDIIDSGDGGVGTGDVQCKSATQTSNTEILQPGNYWACIATDAADTAITAVPSSSYPTNFSSCKFTQTCASGALPATLTAPTCTWQSAEKPFGAIWHSTD